MTFLKIPLLASCPAPTWLFSTGDINKPVSISSWISSRPVGVTAAVACARWCKAVPGPALALASKDASQVLFLLDSWFFS